MKIIILGAGQVGASLAQALLNENHDITVVDTNEERITALQEKYDLRTVLGRVSYPNVLRRAGADEADMVIAVTDNDEANMIACQVAYSLFNVPRKIARIRSQHYLVRDDLFDTDHVPIDVFISPEQLVTGYVEQLIAHPGALQVLSFAAGKVKIIALNTYFATAITHKSIQDITAMAPGKPFKILAVYRNNTALTPSPDLVIENGDEIFISAPTEEVNGLISLFHQTSTTYKRIMIAGAGNIGFSAAKALEKKYQVKVIDQDRRRCELLAEKLDATVLNGEISDQELLVNESIESVDVFCAMTNDDEANIIACLQAHRLGAKQVIALITRTAYIDLIAGGTINIAISPQQATVGSILAQIRQGDVVNVHSLRHGDSEAIEAVAHGDQMTSKVVGRSLSEIRLPKNTVVGAIVRGNKVLMPDPELRIEAEDHVVMYISNKKYIKDVERLFQVGATFF